VSESAPSVLDGSRSLAGNDSRFEGGGIRSGSPGDVSATVKTALPDRDIPLGLTALSPNVARETPLVFPPCPRGELQETALLPWGELQETVPLL
jgi:hypothetical protein